MSHSRPHLLIPEVTHSPRVSVSTSSRLSLPILSNIYMNTKRFVPVHLMPLVFAAIVLLLQPSGVFANWGAEVGRATEGDQAQLASDRVAIGMAQRRLADSITRPLVKDRQMVLLGRTGNNANAAELLDAAYDYWVKKVVGPARDMANNPAASCADANLALLALLSMERQRQLLGLNLDENEKISPKSMEIILMVTTIQDEVLQRCRDEAQDECVATGRIDQIPFTALAQQRQLALLEEKDVDLSDWAKQTLKLCATYDLHFVSTTDFVVGYTVDTVMDGHIKLKFVEDGGKTLGMTLKGETEGGNNPFLVSVKCQRAGSTAITCSPGATPSSYAAQINEMDLLHPEYSVSPDGVPGQHNEGVNKLVMEFRAGLFNIQMVATQARMPPITIPFPVGPQFWMAHIKDRVGQSTSVKVENNKRGLIPIVFDFTYADQNTMKGTQASDSTHFELIHKVDPEAMKELYKPRPADRKRPEDAPKKPLKRPGMATGIQIIDAFR